MTVEKDEAVDIPPEEVNRVGLFFQGGHCVEIDVTEKRAMEIADKIGQAKESRYISNRIIKHTDKKGIRYVIDIGDVMYVKVTPLAVINAEYLDYFHGIGGPYS